MKYLSFLFLIALLQDSSSLDVKNKKFRFGDGLSEIAMYFLDTGLVSSHSSSDNDRLRRNSNRDIGTWSIQGDSLIVDLKRDFANFVGSDTFLIRESTYYIALVPIYDENWLEFDKLVKQKMAESQEVKLIDSLQNVGFKNITIDNHPRATIIFEQFWQSKYVFWVNEQMVLSRY